MATDPTISEEIQYRSEADELANSLTHGTGILLSLGGAVLIIPATQAANLGVRLSVIAYVASLVAVYGFSTASHAVRSMEKKNRLRAWDQGMIYFLIVGTYTPFIATYLPPTQAGLLTVVLWLAAGIGFWLKVVVKHRVNAFSSWSYLALGWLPVLPLIGHVPLGCVMWMAIGGMSYTVGVIFLMLDVRVSFFHAIWHILVIVASACHFYAILAYVVA
ncbi:MAG: hemolysin III family protein [Planctomycetes bacterium]|nr:hemolysin III family protein [Planctomycetota bacterium]